MVLSQLNAVNNRSKVPMQPTQGPSFEERNTHYGERIIEIITQIKSKDEETIKIIEVMLEPLTQGNNNVLSIEEIHEGLEDIYTQISTLKDELERE